MAATAEFSVRFRAPLMVGEETLTEALVERASRRLIEARATMRRRSDGAVIAEAGGKFVL
jgi:acyl-CoA thioesterase FadM